jgi:hypothetical protein
VSRPIREVLATVPGHDPVAFDDTALGRYLRDHYDTDAEKRRNHRHAVRDDFYHDGGTAVLEAVVDEMYKDPQVKDLRKPWAKHARFANVIKRIVGDLSTVYVEPAPRKVGGSEENEARYRAICESLMLDEQMKEANRLVNLHRVILVGPRVRVDEDGVPSMVLDFVTPSVVRAVVHPTDTSLVVAWLIKCDDRVRKDYTANRRVAWQLWTSHELINLDERMVPIGDDTIHGIGMNRWVPMSLSPIGIAGFWPGEEGEDLVAAQIAIGISNIQMLKEAKSTNRQTILGGDVGNAPRNQALDTETPIHLPDGVTATTVDMSTDIGVYTKTSDHVLERTGNGYGLSMAQLTHQGTQSAEARELLMEPLNMLRRQQIGFFRRWEKRLAQVMAAVAKRYAPAELGFEVVEWSQDFGEIQSITPFKQRVEEYVAARAIGADNILAFIRRENPDLADDDAALARLIENVGVETMRLVLMRPQMAISGGTADGTRQTGDEPDAAPNGRPPARPFEAAA